jgi:cell division protease FtsH
LKFSKNVAIYLLIILIAVILIRWSNPPASKDLGIDYNSFYQAVLEDKVQEVTRVEETSGVLYSVTLKDNTKYEILGPSEDPQLLEALKAHVPVVKSDTPAEAPWWMSLATTLLLPLVIVGLFFFMMQQTQGGGNRVMQFGKSRAKLVSDDKKRITFDDVAGADEVKEELQEIVEYLKLPRKFSELGAKIPKGVLLYGPPGTGKTLLARAVAGEAGVPFFSISGSDFVEMFVGVGASRVRDLFEQAKKSAPCIIFIDEIDAVGRQRGAGLGGGHDEREQTLNQLLVEMDGFSGNEGVIVIAATNRSDILDPALLRPGRFDRHIVVDVPDVRGRAEILKVHSKNKPLRDNVDLEVIARRTPGFTGADLANLLNEAALLSARRGDKDIGMQALEEAVERVIAGPEKKSRVISDFEKKLVSYHEAGHALVGELLTYTDPLHKVSIIPRGRAGGYTLHLPKEDRNYMTKSQLLDQITLLLGGRVAESLVLNEISTGASSDLERATGIVRKMITELGMSEELGPLTFGHKEEQVFLGRDIARDRNYSEAVAYAIDKESKKIIEECYQKAQNLLSQNMDKLHAVAEALMEKETLEAKEFAALLAKFDTPAAGSPPDTESGLVSAATKGPEMEISAAMPALAGENKVSDLTGNEGLPETGSSAAGTETLPESGEVLLPEQKV